MLQLILEKLLDQFDQIVMSTLEENARTKQGCQVFEECQAVQYAEKTVLLGVEIIFLGSYLSIYMTPYVFQF